MSRWFPSDQRDFFYNEWTNTEVGIVVTDNDTNHWHLDKRFNIGHFLTTLIIVAALFKWSGDMERVNEVQNTRLDALEKTQAKQMELIQREMTASNASILREMTQLRSSMDRLMSKVDDLAHKE